MYVDAADSLGLGRGRYEPGTTRLLRKRVRPGQTVIDLGAGLGYFTLCLSDWVGQKGRVVAFEADPRNADMVRANVRLNRCENVDVIKKAVSNRAGSLRLYRTAFNRGMNRIYPSIYCDKEAPVEIEAISLDEYAAGNLDRVDFIKMDVEGAEALALEGMKETLARNRHIGLLTEFAPGSIMECGGDPVSFVQEIISHGFTIYGVLDAGIIGRFFRNTLKRYNPDRYLREVQAFVKALRELIADYEQRRRVTNGADLSPGKVGKLISREMRRRGISIPVMQNIFCVRQSDS
jgi:FkbM family methyltransferase